MRLLQGTEIVHIVKASEHSREAYKGIMLCYDIIKHFL